MGLIGSASMRFFDIMDISSDFLLFPASDWVENEDYCKAKLVVDGIQVVNEAAERGVKLCHDHIGITKDKNQFQSVLQVVEDARRRNPYQRTLTVVSD